MRNAMYAHYLAGTRLPTPRSQAHSGLSQGHGLALVQACRQIYNEMAPLIRTSGAKYVPVARGMELGALMHQVVHGGYPSLAPANRTYLEALTACMNVQIHLHARKDAARMSKRISGLLHRLVQALLIFTAASARIVQRYNNTGEKRQAMVHFDHYFAYWEAPMLTYADWYHLHIALGVMGRDAYTTWNVRLYFNTDDRVALSRAACRYLRLKEMCRDGEYLNIQVTAEVYGAYRISREEELS